MNEKEDFLKSTRYEKTNSKLSYRENIIGSEEIKKKYNNFALSNKNSRKKSD